MKPPLVLPFTGIEAQKLLPLREERHNKSDFGKALIIAGSTGMFGAAILSATASARVGSGYTQVLSSKNFPIYRHPDFLYFDIKKTDLKELQFNAVAVGPGLGVKSLTKKILRQLAKLHCKKMVVDADALTVLNKDKKIQPLNTWVLTPHEGELARLLDVSVAEIRRDRQAALVAAQIKYQCCILLKGHRSLLTNGQKIFQIQSGNASLAKAGTGDVLAGMIAGLMAQGLESMDAAATATWIHGAIADHWLAQKKDISSLMATDLLHELPAAIQKLRSGLF